MSKEIVKGIMIFCIISLAGVFGYVIGSKEKDNGYKPVYIDKKAKNISLAGFDKLLLDSSVRNYMITGCRITVGEDLTRIQMGRLIIRTDSMTYVFEGEHGAGGTVIHTDLSFMSIDGPVEAGFR